MIIPEFYENYCTWSVLLCESKHPI